MSRLFNALNGVEFAYVICQEVDQVLDMDTRFDSDEPVQLNHAMMFTLRVEQYPIEQPFSFQVSQVFKGMQSPKSLKAQIKDIVRRNFAGDLRFGMNITYPKVTCDHRISIDPLPGGQAIVSRVQPRIVDSPMDLDPMADRRIDTRGHVAVQPSVIIDPKAQAIADLEKQLAALRASVGETSAPVVIPQSHTVNRDYDPTTGTGLEITRGWAQSPGDAMAQSFGAGSAIGAVQPREAIDRIELGVSHPPLSEGGMPPPDQVRREHGLPVPQTTMVGTQMVDIPANLF